MRKLPVFRSVKEVYAGVTRHYLDLLVSAPLAIAAYVAGVLIFSYINSKVEVSGISEQAAGKMMLEGWKQHAPLALVGIILLTAGVLASAVRWHRFVLLGERHRSGWGGLETGYLWSSVKIFLSMFGIGMAVSVLIVIAYGISNMDGGLANTIKSGGWANAATVLVVLIFVSSYLWLVSVGARLSLALPDVALGGRGRVGEALDRTVGNSWRLLGYWILVQVVVAIGAAIVGKIVRAAIGPHLDPSTANIVATVVTLPVSVYVLMIGVTMLSVAYREIVGLKDADSGAGMEAGPAARIEPI